MSTTCICLFPALFLIMDCFSSSFNNFMKGQNNKFCRYSNDLLKTLAYEILNTSPQHFFIGRKHTMLEKLLLEHWTRRC